MKLRYLLLSIIILFIFGMGVNAEPAVGVIKTESDKITLLAAIERISQEYEVYFTFDMTLVSDVEVEYEDRSYSSAQEAVSHILKGTNLRYKFYDRRFVILYKEDQEGLESLRQMSRHLDGLISEGEKTIASAPKREIRAVPRLSSKLSSREIQRIAFTVEGKVVDQGGQPLIGVNIQVKGSNKGTATDFDGNFILEDTDENAVLVISYVGYQTQEVSISGRSTINITMTSDSQLLDEVVVVGYGTMKKSDLTGSVVPIELKDLNEIPISRVEEALAGKAAGVQVKAVSGEPGIAPQIRIRGVGSISANVDPLYVIDGFPTTDLQMINPQDIESIQVLKDASATAIYGSRGSNGVVIITTKNGAAGSPSITFDSYMGFQRVEKIPKMKNSMEQANWFLDGMRNKNIDLGNDVSGDPLKWNSPVPQVIMDIIEGRNTIDEDPLNSIFVTAPQNNFQIGISGGNEDIKYLISGNFTDQDGIVVNSNFKRYSLRANIDAQLTQRLKARVNLSPTYIEQASLPVTGEGCCLGSNIVAAALQIHNFYPILNEDGSYFNYDGLPALAAVYNPLAVAKETETMKNKLGLFGNVNLEYSVLDNLHFNVLAGSNIVNLKGMRFRPSLDVFFGEPPTGRDEAMFSVNWLSEFSLDYNKQIGLHNLKGLIGYTLQKESIYNNFIESNQFPNNIVPTLNAATSINAGESQIQKWSMMSYLARINYSYKDRYLITSSIRTDGSSRFGENNKFATFPSLAVAWHLGREEFLSGIDKIGISNLKIRGSFGQSGNNNIGNYQQYATMGFTNYPFGNRPFSGFIQNNLENPDLTWEKQSQINTGLDIELFNGRISFNFDYFNSINKDLLLNVNIPSITGYRTSLQNIGKVRNKGTEFSVATINIDKQFMWTTDFNLSSYKNEVLKLGPEDDPIYAGNNITMVGQPIGMFWGYLTDGIFKNKSDLEKGPIYNPGSSDASRVGDIRFVDINGDGIIDNKDNTIIGNPYPDFYFGLRNYIEYNNLNLTINLQGSYGNDVLSVTRDAGNSGRSRVRGYAFANDYWKSEEDPGDGITPRPNDSPTGGPRRPNQNWVDDGSYLRVTNITLGYKVPNNFIKKLNLNSVRVYITANNPILVTNFVSFNPDVSFRGDPLRPGNEANDYPLSKGYIFGLNVSL